MATREDDCQIKPGTWGLYVHHRCGLERNGLPEYIPGTFASRQPEAVR